MTLTRDQEHDEIVAAMVETAKQNPSATYGEFAEAIIERLKQANTAVPTREAVGGSAPLTKEALTAIMARWFEETGIGAWAHFDDEDIILLEGMLREAVGGNAGDEALRRATRELLALHVSDAAGEPLRPSDWEAAIDRLNAALGTFGDEWDDNGAEKERGE